MLFKSKRAVTSMFQSRCPIEATEEAVVNAMAAAETMSGVNGNTVYATLHQRLREVLKKYNRLVE